MENTAPSFDQPLDMLVACHERIEDQLRALEGLTQQLRANGCDTQAQAAAQAALRYFDTSGALHHQDEDHDLFPLLRLLAAAQGQVAIAAAIDELEREHETMAGQWSRLRARLQQLVLGDGALDGEELSRFAWLYRRHMDRESAAVLPFAKKALHAAQLKELGERMAARRAVAFKESEHVRTASG
jgi:hemerythrin-like domain-containing protein